MKRHRYYFSYMCILPYGSIHFGYGFTKPYKKFDKDAIEEVREYLRNELQEDLNLSIDPTRILLSFTKLEAWCFKKENYLARGSFSFGIYRIVNSDLKRNLPLVANFLI